MALLRRVAEGDRDAFAELFDRHAPMVLGLLIRRLTHRELAEEILQETFVQVWQQADRYLSERASPRGWLLVLARSRARDRLRSHLAGARRDDAIYRVERKRRNASPVGTERLEALDRLRRVRSALGQLPEAQRLCIELAFYEGLSHSEIADRLGEPLGTVKSRILLGMKKLRGELAA